MVKQGGEDGETEQKLLFSTCFVCFSFFSFLFKSELSITAIVSSIWNMQIADSAFACWCLTFPFGGRSPTQLRSLSAVCLQTPVILPHSATLRQSHFSTSHPRCVCLEAVGMGWGRLVGEGRDVRQGQMIWGSGGGENWKCVTARHFITILKTFSTKTSRSFPLVLVKTYVPPSLCYLKRILSFDTSEICLAVLNCAEKLEAVVTLNLAIFNMSVM